MASHRTPFLDSTLLTFEHAATVHEPRETSSSLRDIFGKRRVEEGLAAAGPVLLEHPLRHRRHSAAAELLRKSYSQPWLLDEYASLVARVTSVILDPPRWTVLLAKTPSELSLYLRRLAYDGPAHHRTVHPLIQQLLHGFIDKIASTVTIVRRWYAQLSGSASEWLSSVFNHWPASEPEVYLTPLAVVVFLANEDYSRIEKRNSRAVTCHDLSLPEELRGKFILIREGSEAHFFKRSSTNHFHRPAIEQVILHELLHVLFFLHFERARLLSSSDTRRALLSLPCSTDHEGHLRIADAVGKSRSEDARTEIISHGATTGLPLSLVAFEGNRWHRHLDAVDSFLTNHGAVDSAVTASIRAVYEQRYFRYLEELREYLGVARQLFERSANAPDFPTAKAVSLLLATPFEHRSLLFPYLSRPVGYAKRQG